MDYEQKYKEALKIMESLHSVVKYQSSSDALLASQTIEKAFPEIRESEDEKIRKEIISYIKSSAAVTNKDWIAWLEKQSEQKSWSEDDEKMISLLIKIFEVNHPNEHFKVNPIDTTNMESISIKEIVDWLQSIKPQSKWKPNEEQLRAIINSAQGLYQCKEKEVLLDLYEQLKNL